MSAIDPVLLNDWHVVAQSQNLQEGTVLQTHLLRQDLVLWRCQDQIHAWRDLCPHRGARLSQGWVEGDNLVCPYHGYVFNNEGQCVSIPAHPNYKPPKQACVQTYQVKERYGLVWVCLGKPEQDIPPFPEWDDLSYHRFFGGPFHFHTSGFRMMENFFDLSHAPFVHGGLLADQNRPVINDYKVELHADGLTFGEVLLWPPSDGTGQVEPHNYNYHVFRPLTAYFRRGPAECRFNIFFTVTPTEEEECIGRIWLVMNFGELTQAEIQPFISKVIAQDSRIVELQQPRRLPLNLQEEFHVPSDLASVRYRQWLKKLGVTFGTVGSGE